MTKQGLPVYDIYSIGKESRSQDLLAERFSDYLDKHYHHLRRPHGHSFYHLVLFTSGSGYHTIDFNRFDVKKFQLYCMVPGQVHSWHFNGKADGYLIHFSESFFRFFLADQQFLHRFTFFSGNSEDGVLQIPARLQPQVVQLFETIIKEKEQAAADSADVIRLQLLQLFILLERSCVQNSRHVPSQKLLLLKNFQQLIEQHFRTWRLPKEYAALLYITPNHLNALCHELLGKTAGELIRNRIMLEAKRLLTNADMTIAEIAWNLQFKDNSYFNRFFKKDAGITPEEFRKQLLTDKL